MFFKCSCQNRFNGGSYLRIPVPGFEFRTRHDFDFCGLPIVETLCIGLLTPREYSSASIFPLFLFIEETKQKKNILFFSDVTAGSFIFPLFCWPSFLIRVARTTIITLLLLLIPGIHGSQKAFPSKRRNKNTRVFPRRG